MSQEQPPELPDGDEPAVGPELPGAEQREDQANDHRPRIWAGSLVDYNNGRPYGAWIDAARDPEAIQADIDAMLAASPWTARIGEPAEGWSIEDFDGFGGCELRGLTDLELVSQIATGIVEHGLAFAAWAGVIEHPENLARFTDAYLGEYDSLEAYAEELISDLGVNELLDRVVPPSLRPYVDINIAGYAQNMWLNGEVQVYHRSGGGVWLFNGE